MICQHKHSLKLPTHISDTIILQMIMNKRYCEAKLVLVPVGSSTQNIKKYVDALASREISPPLFFNYGPSQYTTEIQKCLDDPLNPCYIMPHKEQLCINDLARLLVLLK